MNPSLKRVVEGLCAIAPFTYYCTTGGHSWTLRIAHNTNPPAPDGTNLDCPNHAPEEDAA